MRVYLLILILGLLSSCTGVYFAQPQPATGEVLSAFPEEYRGTYIKEDDVNFSVNGDSYSYLEEVEKEYALDEFDELDGVKIENDLVFDESIPGDGIKYTLENDTIRYSTRVTVHEKIGSNRVLKKFKKYLVVNERMDDGNNEREAWNTYLVEKLPNGNLRLFIVGNFDSDKKVDLKRLQLLKTITGFDEEKYSTLGVDSKAYLVNPNDKEFKKMIKKGLFSESTEYKKISSN